MPVDLPGIPRDFWSFKHALKFLGKRAAQPPLGLMTVAALLPKAWKKRLVDTNVERLRDRDLAWADVVLLSGCTSSATRWCHRRAVPRARIADGGGRTHRQQPFGGRTQGGPRGDRRGRGMIAGWRATGAGNRRARLPGRRKAGDGDQPMPD
jgi:hypothetical protein